MSAHAWGCGEQASEEAGMDSQQIREAEDKMSKAVHACREELAVIRTGRASPKLVEHLQVEYYGSRVPSTRTAGIPGPEPGRPAFPPTARTALPPTGKATTPPELG